MKYTTPSTTSCSTPYDTRGILVPGTRTGEYHRVTDTGDRRLSPRMQSYLDRQGFRTCSRRRFEKEFAAALLERYNTRGRALYRLFDPTPFASQLVQIALSFEATDPESGRGHSFRVFAYPSHFEYEERQEIRVYQLASVLAYKQEETYQTSTDLSESRMRYPPGTSSFYRAPTARDWLSFTHMSARWELKRILNPLEARTCKEAEAFIAEYFEIKTAELSRTEMSETTGSVLRIQAGHCRF